MGSSEGCAGLQGRAVFCIARDEMDPELCAAGAEQGGVEEVFEGVAHAGGGGAAEAGA